MPAEGRRPLYAESQDARLISTTAGNAGLWYDKFCNQWTGDWKLGDGGKLKWIEQVANLDGTPARRVGNSQLLQEAARRQADLVAGQGGRTIRRATVWRFVSGLGRSHPVENGFAWHHALGVPYLPGSGVKGVARAWAKWQNNQKHPDIDRIFGPEKAGAVGSVIFLGALPVEAVALEADVMTPHYGPWYQADSTDWSRPEARDNPGVPGDWHSPVPIPFLTVAAGQTFQFALLPRTGDASASRLRPCCAKPWQPSAPVPRPPSATGCSAIYPKEKRRAASQHRSQAWRDPLSNRQAGFHRARSSKPGSRK